MHIVLAAATYNEIGITTQWIRENGLNISTLFTGIGSTAACYALTSLILNEKPDLILQAGIAGSFVPALQPGSIALVETEVFADLGAEENGELVDIFDLGLTAINEYPYQNKWLPNPDTARWSKSGLPFVKGATINRISSSPEHLKLIRAKYNPDVESMEGAALHYVCRIQKVPFLQIRAISNFAGERNKKNWKLPESIAALNLTLKEILTHL